MLLVELKFIPDSDLEFQLTDTGLTLQKLSGWYVSAHRWAISKGYKSGFPTFIWNQSQKPDHYNWQTVLIRGNFADILHVPEYEILETLSETDLTINTLAGKHLATHLWSKQNGFASGFPTHDKVISDSVEYIVICFPQNNVDIVLSNESDLGRLMYPFFDLEKPNGRQAGAHLLAKANGCISGYPTYQKQPSRSNQRVFEHVYLRAVS